MSSKQPPAPRGMPLQLDGGRPGAGMHQGDDSIDDADLQSLAGDDSMGDNSEGSFLKIVGRAADPFDKEAWDDDFDLDALDGLDGPVGADANTDAAPKSSALADAAFGSDDDAWGDDDQPLEKVKQDKSPPYKPKTTPSGHATLSGDKSTDLTELDTGAADLTDADFAELESFNTHLPAPSAGGRKLPTRGGANISVPASPALNSTRLRGTSNAHDKWGGDDDDMGDMDFGGLGGGNNGAAADTLSNVSEDWDAELDADATFRAQRQAVMSAAQNQKQSIRKLLQGMDADDDDDDDDARHDAMSPTAARVTTAAATAVPAVIGPAAATSSQPSAHAAASSSSAAPAAVLLTQSEFKARMRGMIRPSYRLHSSLKSSASSGGRQIEFVLYPVPPALYSMRTPDGFRGLGEKHLEAWLGDITRKHIPSTNLEDIYAATPPYVPPSPTDTFPLYDHLCYAYQHALLAYRVMAYQEAWNIISSLFWFLDAQFPLPRVQAVVDHPAAWSVVHHLLHLAGRLWSHHVARSFYRIIVLTKTRLFPSYARLVELLEIEAVAHHDGRQANKLLRALCGTYAKVADIAVRYQPPQVPGNANSGHQGGSGARSGSNAAGTTRSGFTSPQAAGLSGGTGMGKTPYGVDLGAIAVEAAVRALTALQLYLTSTSPLTTGPLAPSAEWDDDSPEFRWLELAWETHAAAAEGGNHGEAAPGSPGGLEALVWRLCGPPDFRISLLRTLYDKLGVGASFCKATAAYVLGCHEWCIDDERPMEEHVMLAERLLMEALYSLDGMAATPHPGGFAAATVAAMSVTPPLAALNNGVSCAIAGGSPGPGSIAGSGSSGGPSSGQKGKRLSFAAVPGAGLPGTGTGAGAGSSSSSTSPSTDSTLAPLPWIRLTSTPILSELGLNVLQLFGDILLVLNKYTYAIRAYESVLPAYTFRKCAEHHVLYRRLSEVCLQHGDVSRSTVYYLKLLQTSVVDGNLDTYVFVTQELAKLYTRQGHYQRAESHLLTAIAFLLPFIAAPAQALAKGLLESRHSTQQDRQGRQPVDNAVQLIAQASWLAAQRVVIAQAETLSAGAAQQQLQQLQQQRTQQHQESGSDDVLAPLMSAPPPNVPPTPAGSDASTATTVPAMTISGMGVPLGAGALHQCSNDFQEALNLCAPPATAATQLLSFYSTEDDRVQIRTALLKTVRDPFVASGVTPFVVPPLAAMGESGDSGVVAPSATRAPSVKGAVSASGLSLGLAAQRAAATAAAGQEHEHLMTHHEEELLGPVDSFAVSPDGAPVLQAPPQAFGRTGLVAGAGSMPTREKYATLNPRSGFSVPPEPVRQLSRPLSTPSAGMRFGAGHDAPSMLNTVGPGSPPGGSDMFPFPPPTGTAASAPSSQVSTSGLTNPTWTSFSLSPLPPTFVLPTLPVPSSGVSRLLTVPVSEIKAAVANLYVELAKLYLSGGKMVHAIALLESLKLRAWPVLNSSNSNAIGGFGAWLTDAAGITGNTNSSSSAQSSQSLALRVHAQLGIVPAYQVPSAAAAAGSPVHLGPHITSTPGSASAAGVASPGPAPAVGAASPAPPVAGGPTTAPAVMAAMALASQVAVQALTTSPFAPPVPSPTWSTLAKLGAALPRAKQLAIDTMLVIAYVRLGLPRRAHRLLSVLDARWLHSQPERQLVQALLPHSQAGGAGGAASGGAGGAARAAAGAQGAGAGGEAAEGKGDGWTASSASLFGIGATGDAEGAGAPGGGDASTFHSLDLADARVTALTMTGNHQLALSWIALAQAQCPPSALHLSARLMFRKGVVYQDLIFAQMERGATDGLGESQNQQQQNQQGKDTGSEGVNAPSGDSFPGNWGQTTHAPTIIGDGDNALVLPDPRACVSALSFAYQYYAGFGDRVRMAHCLQNIVETYLHIAFVALVVLHHPPRALTNWLRIAGFEVASERPAPATHFSSPLSLMDIALANDPGATQAAEDALAAKSLKSFCTTLESSAITAMDTASKAFLPLLMLQCLLNLAELRLLQDQPAAAMSYWSEARHSFAAMFLVGREVILPARAPADVWAQVHRVFSRLIRLLMVLDPIVINANISLLTAWSRFETQYFATRTSLCALEGIEDFRQSAPSAFNAQNYDTIDRRSGSGQSGSTINAYMAAGSGAGGTRRGTDGTGTYNAGMGTATYSAGLFPGGAIDGRSGRWGGTVPETWRGGNLAQGGRGGSLGAAGNGQGNDINAAEVTAALNSFDELTHPSYLPPCPAPYKYVFTTNQAGGSGSGGNGGGAGGQGTGPNGASGPASHGATVLAALSAPSVLTTAAIGSSGSAVPAFSAAVVAAANASGSNNPYGASAIMGPSALITAMLRAEESTLALGVSAYPVLLPLAINAQTHANSAADGAPMSPPPPPPTVSAAGDSGSMSMHLQHPASPTPVRSSGGSATVGGSAAALARAAAAGKDSVPHASPGSGLPRTLPRSFAPGTSSGAGTAPGALGGSGSGQPGSSGSPSSGGPASSPAAPPALVSRTVRCGVAALHDLDAAILAFDEFGGGGGGGPGPGLGASMLSGMSGSGASAHETVELRVRVESETERLHTLQLQLAHSLRQGALAYVAANNSSNPSATSPLAPATPMSPADAAVAVAAAAAAQSTAAASNTSSGGASGPGVSGAASGVSGGNSSVGQGGSSRPGSLAVGSVGSAAAGAGVLGSGDRGSIIAGSPENAGVPVLATAAAAGSVPPMGASPDANADSPIGSAPPATITVATSIDTTTLVSPSQRSSIVGPRGAAPGLYSSATAAGADANNAAENPVSPPAVIALAVGPFAAESAPLFTLASPVHTTATGTTGRGSKVSVLTGVPTPLHLAKTAALAAAAHATAAVSAVFAVQQRFAPAPTAAASVSGIAPQGSQQVAAAFGIVPAGAAAAAAAAAAAGGGSAIAGFVPPSLSTRPIVEMGSLGLWSPSATAVAGVTLLSPIGFAPAFARPPMLPPLTTNNTVPASVVAAAPAATGLHTSGSNRRGGATTLAPPTMGRQVSVTPPATLNAPVTHNHHGGAGHRRTNSGQIFLMSPPPPPGMGARDASAAPPRPPPVPAAATAAAAAAAAAASATGPGGLTVSVSNMPDAALESSDSIPIPGASSSSNLVNSSSTVGAGAPPPIPGRRSSVTRGGIVPGASARRNSALGGGPLPLVPRPSVTGAGMVVPLTPRRPQPSVNPVVAAQQALAIAAFNWDAYSSVGLPPGVMFGMGPFHAFLQWHLPPGVTAVQPMAAILAASPGLFPPAPVPRSLLTIGSSGSDGGSGGSGGSNQSRGFGFGGTRQSAAAAAAAAADAEASADGSATPSVPAKSAEAGSSSGGSPGSPAPERPPLPSSNPASRDARAAVGPVPGGGGLFGANPAANTGSAGHNLLLHALPDDFSNAVSQLSEHAPRKEPKEKEREQLLASLRPTDLPLSDHVLASMVAASSMARSDVRSRKGFTDPLLESRAAAIGSRVVFALNEMERRVADTAGMSNEAALLDAARVNKEVFKRLITAMTRLRHAAIETLPAPVTAGLPGAGCSGVSGSCSCEGCARHIAAATMQRGSGTGAMATASYAANTSSFATAGLGTLAAAINAAAAAASGVSVCDSDAAVQACFSRSPASTPPVTAPVPATAPSASASPAQLLAQVESHSSVSVYAQTPSGAVLTNSADGGTTDGPSAPLELPSYQPSLASAAALAVGGGAAYGATGTAAAVAAATAAGVGAIGYYGNGLYVAPSDAMVAAAAAAAAAGASAGGVGANPPLQPVVAPSSAASAAASAAASVLTGTGTGTGTSTNPSFGVGFEPSIAEPYSHVMLLPPGGDAAANAAAAAGGGAGSGSGCGSRRESVSASAGSAAAAAAAAAAASVAAAAGSGPTGFAQGFNIATASTPAAAVASATGVFSAIAAMAAPLGGSAFAYPPPCVSERVFGPTPSEPLVRGDARRVEAHAHQSLFTVVVGNVVTMFLPKHRRRLSRVLTARNSFVDFSRRPPQVCPTPELMRDMLIHIMSPLPTSRRLPISGDAYVKAHRRAFAQAPALSAQQQQQGGGARARTALASLFDQLGSAPAGSTGTAGSGTGSAGGAAADDSISVGSTASGAIVGSGQGGAGGAQTSATPGMPHRSLGGAGGAGPASSSSAAGAGGAGGAGAGGSIAPSMPRAMSLRGPLDGLPAAGAAGGAGAGAGAGPGAAGAGAGAAGAGAVGKRGSMDATGDNGDDGDGNGDKNGGGVGAGKGKSKKPLFASVSASPEVRYPYTAVAHSLFDDVYCSEPLVPPTTYRLPAPTSIPGTSAADSVGSVAPSAAAPAAAGAPPANCDAAAAASAASVAASAGRVMSTTIPTGFLPAPTLAALVRAPVPLAPGQQQQQRRGGGGTGSASSTATAPLSTAAGGIGSPAPISSASAQQQQQQQQPPMPPGAFRRTPVPSAGSAGSAGGSGAASIAPLLPPYVTARTVAPTTTWDARPPASVAPTLAHAATVDVFLPKLHELAMRFYLHSRGVARSGRETLTAAAAQLRAAETPGAARSQGTAAALSAIGAGSSALKQPVSLAAMAAASGHPASPPPAGASGRVPPPPLDVSLGQSRNPQRALSPTAAAASAGAGAGAGDVVGPGGFRSPRAAAAAAAAAAAGSSPAACGTWTWAGATPKAIVAAGHATAPPPAPVPAAAEGEDVVDATTPAAAAAAAPAAPGKSNKLHAYVRVAAAAAAFKPRQPTNIDPSAPPTPLASSGPAHPPATPSSAARAHFTALAASAASTPAHGASGHAGERPFSSGASASPRAAVPTVSGLLSGAAHPLWPSVPHSPAYYLRFPATSPAAPAAPVPPLVAAHLFLSTSDPLAPHTSAMSPAVLLGLAARSPLSAYAVLASCGRVPIDGGLLTCPSGDAPGSKPGSLTAPLDPVAVAAGASSGSGRGPPPPPTVSGVTSGGGRPTPSPSAAGKLGGIGGGMTTGAVGAAIVSSPLPWLTRSFPIPVLGASTLRTFPATRTISLADSEALLPPSLDAVGLQDTLDALGPSELAVLLAAVMCESRVMFVSHSPARVRAVMETALALLYPFKWQHMVVFDLPRHAGELLWQRRPFLIGVNTVVFDNIVAQQALASRPVGYPTDPLANVPPALRSTIVAGAGSSGRVFAPPGRSAGATHGGSEYVAAAQAGGANPSGAPVPIGGPAQGAGGTVSTLNGPKLLASSAGPGVGAGAGGPGAGATAAGTSAGGLGVGAGAGAPVSGLAGANTRRGGVGYGRPNVDHLRGPAAASPPPAGGSQGAVASATKGIRSVFGGLGGLFKPSRTTGRRATRAGPAGTTEAQYYGTEAAPLSGVPADVVVVDLDTHTVRFATGTFPLLPEEVRAKVQRACKAFSTALLLTRMRRTNPNAAVHNSIAVAAALQAQASVPGAASAGPPVGVSSSSAASAAAAAAAAAAAVAAGGGDADAAAAVAGIPRTVPLPPNTTGPAAAAAAHAPTAAGLSAVLPHTSPLNPAVQALAPLATPGLLAPVPTPADPSAPQATAVTAFRNSVLDAMLTLFASYCLFWDKSASGTMVEPPKTDPTTGHQFVDINASIRPRSAAPAASSSSSTGTTVAPTAAKFGGKLGASGIVSADASAAAAAAATPAPGGSGDVPRAPSAHSHGHGLGLAGIDGEGVNGVPLVMTTAPGAITGSLARPGAPATLPVLPVHQEFDLELEGGRAVVHSGDAEVVLADNVPVSMHTGSDWYLMLDYDLPSFLDNVKPASRAFVNVVARTAMFRHFLAVRHRLRGLPVCMYLFDQWAVLKVHNRWTHKLAPRRQANLGAALQVSRQGGRYHRRYCELPPHGSRILVHHEATMQPALAPKHDRTIVPVVCRVTYPVPVDPNQSTRSTSFPFALTAVITPEIIVMVAENARREKAAISLRAHRISMSYQSAAAERGSSGSHALTLNLGKRSGPGAGVGAGAGAGGSVARGGSSAGASGLLFSSESSSSAAADDSELPATSTIAAMLSEEEKPLARVLTENDSLEDLVVVTSATHRGPGALVPSPTPTQTLGVLLSSAAAGAGVAQTPAWPTTGLGPVSGGPNVPQPVMGAALQQGMGVWPLTLTQLISVIHAWERGFLFKADSATVRNEWVKALEARLMHPDLITRYRQFM